MAKIPTSITGGAGEHLVCGELLRRGHIAALTYHSVPGVDILAQSLDLTRSVGVQVKTARGNRRYWQMTEKAEDRQAPNLFYVFVLLPFNTDRAPEFYVVPSSVVAEHVRRTNIEWLAQPSRSGRSRKSTSRRAFHDPPAREYLERWDLLGLDTEVK